VSRRLALLFLVTLCHLALVAPAFAASPLASVEASAYIVQNGATGEVLAARNADRPVAIASITKLLTVLVALDRAKLSDVVTVDRRAAVVGESSIELRPGEKLTVHDLVEGALIQSANDAADALALHVAPSYPAFAELMNAKAAELGLHDSHFVRPDGLDAPGEWSTARDVTRLARIAMRNAFVRSTVRKERDTIAGGRVLTTWDDLLGEFPGLLGVKTGHTASAGWSQVAAVRGRGVTVYATILGEPTRGQRNADLATLLAYGLAQYVVVDAVQRGRVYATAELPYGRAPVPLVAQRGSTLVVRAGRPLVERVVAPAAVPLPVRAGQRLGEVQVSRNGRVIARRPLVAARSVDRPGVGGRVAWYAKRTARHVAGWIT
jgi:D-alanyl-D-alanine carboxypeptidase (penicillin-binding protein 5/6)